MSMWPVRRAKPKSALQKRDTTCLCFALDSEEQKRSRLHHQYAVYQVEYSRNLVFEIGSQMDQVSQALIDRSRVLLNLRTVKTILGYKHRPRYHKRKDRSAEWEVAVEKPAYDLTIFKLHCGKLTLKIYTKGERVLRIEAVVHNTSELRCGRSLEKFPRIVVEAEGILELRNKAIKPLLAAAQGLRPSRGAQNPSLIDTHYDTIRTAMCGVFQALGLAA
jgi:hypothetical protein